MALIIVNFVDYFVYGFFVFLGFLTGVSVIHFCPEEFKTYKLNFRYLSYVLLFFMFVYLLFFVNWVLALLSLFNLVILIYIWDFRVKNLFFTWVLFFLFLVVLNLNYSYFFVFLLFILSHFYSMSFYERDFFYVIIFKSFMNFYFFLILLFFFYIFSLF